MADPVLILPVPPVAAPAPKIPAPGERFDHLLYRLIDENNGVFVGERHDHSAVRESLMHLMPAIKARGVETLSMEIPQQLVDDMLKEKSPEAWLARQPEKELENFTGGKDVALSIAQLVHRANTYDIKVIGHELGMEPNVEAIEKARKDLQQKSPKLAELYNKIREEIKKPDFKGELPEQLIKDINAEVEAIHSDPKRAEEMKAFETLIELTSPARVISEEGMNERNKRSADYIKKNAKGKVLALGGALHSGNYKPEDMFSVRSLDLGGATIIQVEKNPRGISVSNDYKGVDVMLGYSSIDYNHVDPAGAIGQARDTGGKFSNFEVVLPPTIKEMKITSWPPPGGVPTIEQLRPPAVMFPTLPFPNLELPPGLMPETALPPREVAPPGLSPGMPDCPPPTPPSSSLARARPSRCAK